MVADRQDGVSRSGTKGTRAVMTNLRLARQLAEGKREGDAVVCRGTGPVSTSAGEVEGGPAVYPQPRYEARVRAGKVEIRAAKD